MLDENVFSAPDAKQQGEDVLIYNELKATRQLM